MAFTFFIFIANILLIVIFPNACTISGSDSAICGSINQQPEPRHSFRYQCPIFSKISNVTQAFRYCNYNRNRAEKLPSATQALAAPRQPTPSGNSSVPSSLLPPALKIARFCLSPCSKPLKQSKCCFQTCHRLLPECLCMLASGPAVGPCLRPRSQDAQSSDTSAKKRPDPVQREAEGTAVCPDDVRKAGKGPCPQTSGSCLLPRIKSADYWS